jgi:endonuclease/exonuclease/phosphatase family metal-dependent hydrolase
MVHGEAHASHDCPYLFVSWNLQDFGRSKSPEEIERIAEIIVAADVVALQEVVAGKGFGAQAIARLAERYPVLVVFGTISFLIPLARSRAVLNGMRFL